MSGTCPGVRVTTYGAVLGDCVITGDSTVSSGVVQQNGEITFKIGTGTTFTGRMKSPIEGSGTWTNTTGGSGSWTMSHR
jgi:hypothetical protein